MSGIVDTGDEKEDPAKRVDLTVPAATHRYLVALKKKGTHGGTVAGVARTLVEIGIREAIKEGFLKMEGD